MFVVKADRTVEQRAVVTGERVVEDMVIQKGLKPGRDGGHRRPAAARAGLEGRRRAAPSGADPPAGRGQGGAAGGRRPGSGRGASADARHEHLRSLHQAADRDQPAHGWRSRCSASSRTARCRSAICRNVDFPTLNVSAGLPGGDPGTMASAVASPLERQFTTIAGLDEMTSSSGDGQHERHAAVRSRTATSTARPSTCRRRSPR